MTVETATTSLIPAVADQRTAMIPAPQRAGLIASCRAWLVRRNHARVLRDLDPRLARDIGVVPACGDGTPEGFACDPRPLWGVGLPPCATDVAPPWSHDRCKS
jgi:uncharacterized protein YjiS (DUF1127 family)